jgi:transposase-like protein
MRGLVVGLAVMVAMAVNAEGKREVLGLIVAEEEIESAWSSFLEGVIQRGLSGVELVVSDAYAGVKAAVRKVLNGGTWQRCRVHFMCNAAVRLPKVVQQQILDRIKRTFQAPAMHCGASLRGQNPHPVCGPGCPGDPLQGPGFRNAHRQSAQDCSKPRKC